MHPLMDRVLGNTRIFQVFLKQNTFRDSRTQIMVQTIFYVPEEICKAKVESADDIAVDSVKRSNAISALKKKFK